MLAFQCHISYYVEYDIKSKLKSATIALLAHLCMMARSSASSYLASY
jgi:hypothetical protein